MYLYSTIIFILLQIPGLYLSWCVVVETPKPPLPSLNHPLQPNHPRGKCQTECAHEQTQPPKHNKTMSIIAI